MRSNAVSSSRVQWKDLEAFVYNKENKVKIFLKRSPDRHDGADPACQRVAGESGRSSEKSTLRNMIRHAGFDHT